jgi:hypothetical protein
MKITSRKKLTILFSVLSAAVITVALVFLIISRRGGAQDNSFSVPKSLNAIPVDAIAVFTFPGRQELNSFLFENNPLSGELLYGLGSFKVITEKFMRLPAKSDSGNLIFDCALSVHYSSKDRVSSLLVVNVNGLNTNTLIEAFEVNVSNNSIRLFNGVKVYKFNGLEYSITDNKLLVSNSPIILESSLRHISSGASILDNDGFREAVTISDSSVPLLFINHLQSGKLFSAFIDRAFFGGSEFITRFSGWSVFDVNTNSVTINLKGKSYENRGTGNYSTVFKDGSDGITSVQSVLPSDTYLLFSISVNKLNNHIKNHWNYKDYYGKSKSILNDEALKWIESINAKEVAIALIPYEDELRWLTLIRKKRPWYIIAEEKAGLSDETPDIRSFRNKGYIASLFGSLFTNTIEESILESGSWIYIGQNDLLSKIPSGIFKNFTMEQYLSETKAQILSGKRNSMASLIVNGTHLPDSLFSYFRRDHATILRKKFSERGIMIAAFEVNSGKKGEIGYNAYIYADTIKGDKPERNKNLLIPSGPFELRNFTNGEKEYLEQLPGGGLRLLSQEKKGLWTIPFNGKICGKVLQIDFFRNGKLQMLFADDYHIYLLDRLGRFVKPFPKRVDQPVLFGPNIYDIKGDGEIAIMLLHNDKTLRLYQRDGSVYPRWSNIPLHENFKEFPELIGEDSVKYFILRGASVAQIYTTNGICVTSRLSGNNRLSGNTPVEFAADGRIIVKTVKGGKIILNLENGNFEQGK